MRCDQPPHTLPQEASFVDPSVFYEVSALQVDGLHPP